MSKNDLAIKVENIGKRYRIGLKEEMHDTIGASFIDILKSPYTNYRKYRSLYKFDDMKNNDTDGVQSDVIWPLKNISFEVKTGEVVGIVGGNGAGKSTLLKILSRITEPTTGKIEIYGRVASLLEVGTGFHPELTGRENIYLNGTILGMKKNEVDRKFDEIVAFSGVGKFLDTPVKRYSSGMQVRLAFAVAAHLEPDILIIDEVLAVGDAEFQNKCLGKMQNIASSGRTVLFVSHNMGAVQDLCARAILLNNGEVEADGLSGEVIQQYLSKLNENSGVSLDEAHERSGDGSVQFIDAKVFDKTNQENNYLTSGEDISFKFKYKNFAGIKKALIALTIYNHLGVGVTNFDNRMTKFEIPELYDEGWFTCTIPNLPLPLGRYRVAVGIFSGDEVLDLVSNALGFEVFRSTYYESEVPKVSTECACLMPHNWMHETDTTA
jgi:lipopolysaccharide transport system ATP-binding protein